MKEIKLTYGENKILKFLFFRLQAIKEERTDKSQSVIIGLGSKRITLNDLERLKILGLIKYFNTFQNVFKTTLTPKGRSFVNDLFKNYKKDHIEEMFKKLPLPVCPNCNEIKDKELPFFTTAVKQHQIECDCCNLKFQIKVEILFTSK